MATAPTPPRTPTARKSLLGSPSAVSLSVTAMGSPISLQKRKWQGGTLALPLQGLTQPNIGSGSAQVAFMAPVKRQKVGEETKVEQQPQQYQYLSMPASPLRNRNVVQLPANSPCEPQPPPQPAMQPPQLSVQPELPQQIFSAAFRKDHTLLPVEPQKNPVGSRRIDAIAHAMWDVVFIKTDMMNNVTMKAAMYPPLKLRALAKLDWLPSWWFLREMALGVMTRSGWLVDDSERQGEWKDSVEWCKKAEMKLFGDATAAQDL